MNATSLAASSAASTWDWGIALGAASLAISLILAVRELTSRPIPLAHVERAYKKTSGTWVYTGYQLTLANAGRASMIVTGVGTATSEKTGVAGFGGSFVWDDAMVENPSLPHVLDAGRALIYRFPAERYPEDSGPFRVTYLRRSLLTRFRAKVAVATLPVRT